MAIPQVNRQQVPSGQSGAGFISPSVARTGEGAVGAALQQAGVGLSKFALAENQRLIEATKKADIAERFRIQAETDRASFDILARAKTAKFSNQQELNESLASDLASFNTGLAGSMQTLSPEGAESFAAQIPLIEERFRESLTTEYNKAQSQMRKSVADVASSNIADRFLLLGDITNDETNAVINKTFEINSDYMTREDAYKSFTQSAINNMREVAPKDFEASLVGMEKTKAVIESSQMTDEEKNGMVNVIDSELSRIQSRYSPSTGFDDGTAIQLQTLVNSIIVGTEEPVQLEKFLEANRLNLTKTQRQNAIDTVFDFSSRASDNPNKIAMSRPEVKQILSNLNNAIRTGGIIGETTATLSNDDRALLSTVTQQKYTEFYGWVSKNAKEINEGTITAKDIFEKGKEFTQPIVEENTSVFWQTVRRSLVFPGPAIFAIQEIKKLLPDKDISEDINDITDLSDEDLEKLLGATK